MSLSPSGCTNARNAPFARIYLSSSQEKFLYVSLVMKHLKRDNVIEICVRIIFCLYTGLPHMQIENFSFVT